MSLEKYTRTKEVDFVIYTLPRIGGRIKESSCKTGIWSTITKYFVEKISMKEITCEISMFVRAYIEKGGLATERFCTKFFSWHKAGLC